MNNYIIAWISYTIIGQLLIILGYTFIGEIDLAIGFIILLIYIYTGNNNAFRKERLK